MMNLGLEGFHLITCMYAIHYMFSSIDTLEQFLLNVSQNLRDQGYFIGTCLDGPSLVKSFKGKEEIYGEVDDKTIFTLNKQEGIDYKNLTVGNKIDVFFETFNETVEEYLVNLEFLEEKGKDYDLKLIESNLFLDEPGNLLTQYGSKDKKNQDFINNNEDLQKWGLHGIGILYSKK